MVWSVLVLLLVSCAPVNAEPIPSAAKGHQRELTRLAQQEFGLNAPVALFAAQIHQESTWRPDARSPFANGLAQFTPDTAEWIAQAYPSLGRAAPFSPAWSLRAMLVYNRHIKQRINPVYDAAIPACDHWAMTLSGYNGGPGWVSRDRRLATEAGDNPDRWFDHVEHHTARADWARTENRHYPRRILLELEPTYRRAGWHGGAVCP
ncbi:lytic transglycosylase domain-containing protein [Natronospirillum operosum]|uniref:Lytic transglycosylase domain-containing protein n=1 Tax=Natronospirillum operosum TaxID=2759953 RepID=A0A4Z0WAA6_9GAMM|nr:transglycosylase SLT domain-containing protein [Natronospirillum operosum]TGG92516.1 lytic transglycosylase domain-containing protein [Natronospirillum operosum]